MVIFSRSITQKNMATLKGKAKHCYSSQFCSGIYEFLLIFRTQVIIIYEDTEH